MKKILLYAGILCAITTVKAQHYNWANSLGSPHSDEGKAIAVDKAGNIFVAGVYNDTTDFDPSAGVANLTTEWRDIYLAKYDATGKYLWAISLGSTLDENVNAMTLDESGNVYITGSFSHDADFDPSPDTAILRSNGSLDIFFAKYDSNGNYVWAHSMGGAVDWDEGYAIHVDKDGNILLGGFFTNTADFDPSPNVANLISTGWSNAFLAKYDASGKYLWANKLAGPERGLIIGIGTDDSSNIYTSGTFSSRIDFDPSAGTANLSVDDLGSFVAKYAPDGKYIWAKKIDGDDEDVVNGHITDKQGNTYIAGYFRGIADFNPTNDTANLHSNGDEDIFVAKYDKNGNYIWANGFGDNFSDNANGIALDAKHNLCMAGTFEGNIDFDPSASVATLSTGTRNNAFLARYDSSGKYLGAISMSNTSASSECNGVATDADGNAYVIGEFTDVIDCDPSAAIANLTSNGEKDFFMARYNLKQTPGFANDVVKLSGIEIYPNPASNTLNIRSSNDINKVEIYSTDGRLVYKSIADKINSIDISGLSHGLHLLKAGSGTLKFIKE